MSRTPSDYRKFYHCGNSKILTPKGGQPEGYVTKDGSWAAVPMIGSETKLVIIHNGEHVHVARNYDAAKTYILREKRKK